MPPGRPKVTGRVRVNWIVNESTKHTIKDRAKKAKHKSPGKIVDEAFRDTDA